MSSIGTVAYLLLFAGGAFLFLLAALSLGWLLRSHTPSPTKLAAYECGEPAVGPGYLQFDLRFYAVALVFLIFDVEVAFLFPWAVVFGKANQMAAIQAEVQSAAPDVARSLDAAFVRNQRELGVAASGTVAAAADAGASGRLARTAMLEMAAFFAILLVGYAYVWSRGDLDWVRATPTETAAASVPPAAARGEA